MANSTSDRLKIAAVTVSMALAIILLLNTPMKASLLLIKKMARERSIIAMEISIRAAGEMEKKKEKGF